MYSVLIDTLVVPLALLVLCGILKGGVAMRFKALKA